VWAWVIFGGCHGCSSIMIGDLRFVIWRWHMWSILTAFRSWHTPTHSPPVVMSADLASPSPDHVFVRLAKAQRPVPTLHLRLTKSSDNPSRSLLVGQAVITLIRQRQQATRQAGIDRTHRDVRVGLVLSKPSPPGSRNRFLQPLPIKLLSE